tara:strand:- start:668 stop:850 length:183 start_codon:yes stop_codon:yes gene_type:complete
MLLDLLNQNNCETFTSIYESHNNKRKKVKVKKITLTFRTILNKVEITAKPRLEHIYSLIK